MATKKKADVKEAPKSKTKTGASTKGPLPQPQVTGYPAAQRNRRVVEQWELDSIQGQINDVLYLLQMAKPPTFGHSQVMDRIRTAVTVAVAFTGGGEFEDSMEGLDETNPAHVIQTFADAILRRGLVTPESLREAFPRSADVMPDKATSYLAQPYSSGLPRRPMPRS